MIRVPLRVIQNDPLRSQPVFVEITSDRLPLDPNLVIKLLSRESASIEYWLEIAVRKLSIAVAYVLPCW
jgi:hypothetical protein